MIFFVVFLTIAIFIYANSTPKDDSENNEKDYQIKDEFPNVQELHWTHMPLTYSFAEPLINKDERGLDNHQCPYNRIKGITKAFEIIQNETNGSVYFEEMDGSVDITISCYVTKEDGEYLIMGEGGYNSIENRIINGTINFYPFDFGCSYWPDMEVHELLHVFGYEHKNDNTSIMRPIQKGCIGKIDEDIIKDLINRYSN